MELGHGSWPKIMTDMPLSRFGSVQGNVFTIRGPEVIKGTGIRAADLGLLAAATAGAVYYKMGKDGKKIKIPQTKPKDVGPKSLADHQKENPLKKFTKKARGGKVHKKTYAKGGGMRKAVHY